MILKSKKENSSLEISPICAKMIVSRITGIIWILPDVSAGSQLISQSGI